MPERKLLLLADLLERTSEIYGAVVRPDEPQSEAGSLERLF